MFSDPEHTDRSTYCNLTTAAVHNKCSDSQSDWIVLYDSTPEAIIVPCVFSIILILGVVGNSLLILSFVRHKTLSTPHNALVVNLASGDFIFLIVSLPFNMIWFTLPNWLFGLVMCKVSHFAENLATAVVISTLSILSIERCLIVTGKKLWQQQKRGPIWLTLTIWATSLVVSVPNLISANVVKKVINNETYTFCDVYDNSWGDVYTKVHVACKFVFLFCLPLLVIATAYILIAVHLLLRAFPFPQRVKADKPKGKIHLKCFASRKASDKDASRCSVDQSHAGIIIQANSTDGQHNETTTRKTGQENASPVQQQIKSKPSQGNHDKSWSVDSCTEMTELQQTPVLPYSFVYTGPIPTDAISKQEATYGKLRVNATAANDKTSSGTPLLAPQTSSSMPLKETTPLNSSNSGDVKRRYQQRQLSMVAKRRRLALTVLMLIIAFAVCWIPRHVYLLWFHFIPGSYDTFWHVFKITGFCLSFSNSAVNPIVFYILDTTYRSFVHEALCMLCIRKCGKKKPSGVETAVTIGERDYNATIAMTDMKSKDNVTEL